VIAESPEFGPAYFNVSIFYRFTGQTDAAIVASAALPRG
jgi:hypothetical protein